MKSYVRLMLMLVLVVGAAGCMTLKITNNGPNNIEVTANPSPSSPELPLQVAPGQSAVLSWGIGLSQTTTLMVHDTVLPQNFDAEQIEVPGEISSDPSVDVQWNGTQLVLP